MHPTESHFIPAGLLLLTTSCVGFTPSTAVELPLATKYVYRGLLVNDDLVFQPDVSVTVANDEETETFTAGFWGNQELTTETGNSGELSEIDLYVDHGRQVGPAWASIGLVQYQFPDTGFDPTIEAYAMLSHEGEVVTTTVELWYDFKEADGLYVNLNFARDIDLGDQWTLGLFGGAGYSDDGQGDYYYGVDDSGLADLSAAASLARPINEYMSLVLALAYSSVLDSDYEDALDEPNNTTASAGLSIGF